MISALLALWLGVPRIASSVSVERTILERTVVERTAVECSVVERTKMYIHVMPWFEITGNRYGFHWAMNKSTKELQESGKVASHYRPLIGAYDSLDPDVIELQVGWMKVAGFDGVLADWYGTQSHYDYPVIHARTMALFDSCDRFRLKYSVVYEDQTVKNAINGKLVDSDQTGRIVSETAEFLRKAWFARPNWIQIKGKPALFVFGPQFFDEKEWLKLSQTSGGMSLVTLNEQKPYAAGGFDWPVPSQGLGFTERFLERSKNWSFRVPVAYPRFHDFYVQGGNPTGYPLLPDNDGRTYRQTLERALKSGAEMLQVATWNDWQEGTQIEPSIEFGLRDLKVTQEFRRQQDPSFPFSESDLELPFRLYKLRKKGKSAAMLDRVSLALQQSQPSTARTLLNQIEM